MWLGWASCTVYSEGWISRQRKGVLSQWFPVRKGPLFHSQRTHPRDDGNAFKVITVLREMARQQVSQSAWSYSVLLVNDAKASGGAATDWHLPGKCILYGFMQISHWKIAASNCIHVDLQPCCQMSQAFKQESIFEKKNKKTTRVCIYLFSQPSVSVSCNSCSLRSVIVLDIDSTVAGSCFASYQTVEGGVGRVCRQLGRWTA